MAHPCSIFVAFAAALVCTATLSAAEMLQCGNKFCGLDAQCAGKGESQKCECPLSSPMGDPAFRCHSSDQVSCVLIGDPSLKGFTGDLTFMDFPCKYTLSKFDTPLLSRKHNDEAPAAWNTADPGRDRCRVIVHGTNAVTPKGSYYLKDVDIIVTLNIGGSHKTETLTVSLHESQASYSYPPYGEVVIDKSDVQDCLPRLMDIENRIGLTLCYTEESRMWTVSFGICGSTHMNFRAWEGVDENQPYRPGLSIITSGKSAMFSKEDNGYPYTMCDSPQNDEDDVYHSSCKKAGINGKRNCALWAFLDNNPPAQPHYCVDSIKLFNFCPDDKKVKAINSCGSIVTQFAKCVLKKDLSVMNVFEACIVAVCADPTTCSEITKHVHHGDEEDCNSFRAPC